PLPRPPRIVRSCEYSYGYFNSRDKAYSDGSVANPSTGSSSSTILAYIQIEPMKLRDCFSRRKYSIDPTRHFSLLQLASHHRLCHSRYRTSHSPVTSPSPTLSPRSRSKLKMGRVDISMSIGQVRGRNR